MRSILSRLKLCTKEEIGDNRTDLNNKELCLVVLRRENNCKMGATTLPCGVISTNLVTINTNSDQPTVCLIIKMVVNYHKHTTDIYVFVTALSRQQRNIVQLCQGGKRWTLLSKMENADFVLCGPPKLSSWYTTWLVAKAVICSDVL